MNNESEDSRKQNPILGKGDLQQSSLSVAKRHCSATVGRVSLKELGLYG